MSPWNDPRYALRQPLLREREKETDTVAGPDVAQHIPNPAAADVSGEQSSPMEGGRPDQRISADHFRQVGVAAVLSSVQKHHLDGGRSHRAENAGEFPAETSARLRVFSVRCIDWQEPRTAHERAKITTR